MQGVDKLSFPDYPFTLQDEITHRAQKGKNFDQIQIFHIIYILAEASLYFQKNNKKVGSIRPCNVLLNQFGNLLLLTSLSTPNQFDNFHSFAQMKTPALLSPEQLRLIASQSFHLKYKADISDSYSLGMTILQACSLQESLQCYDFKQLQIKEELVQKRLKQLQRKYSPFLLKLLRSLLTLNQNQRPSYVQIFYILKPYSKQILSLQSFVPSKLESQMSLYQYDRIRSSRQFSPILDSASIKETPLREIPATQTKPTSQFVIQPKAQLKFPQKLKTPKKNQPMVFEQNRESINAKIQPAFHQHLKKKQFSLETLNEKNKPIWLPRQPSKLQLNEAVHTTSIIRMVQPKFQLPRSEYQRIIQQINHKNQVRQQLNKVETNRILQNNMLRLVESKVDMRP